MSVEQDKAFVRTFIGVIVALAAITVFLIVLASVRGVSPAVEQERQALAVSRAEQNLQPPAGVRVAGEPLPPAFEAKASAEPRSAEQVVNTVCAGCHGTGVLGAPRTGVAADWTPRMSQGFETVVKHAIEGIRAMPPRGGDASLSDEEVRAAVVYMLEQSDIQVPQQ